MLSKIAGPLMKLAVPLAKNIWSPLGTTVAGAIDAGVQKKMHGNSNPNNFKWRNEWYNQNCSSS